MQKDRPEDAIANFGKVDAAGKFTQYWVKGKIGESNLTPKHEVQVGKNELIVTGTDNKLVKISLK
ncbi:MAG: hypothetical protein IPJ60_08750 [Sphingobacteriaceae bacterium]|nr:hypothetical protein [Sphingobacteriaceae bacterium]